MWKNVVEVEGFETGDVLRVKSFTPVFNIICKHYAVVYYKGKTPYVTHCISEEIVSETLEEFEKKRTIYEVFRNEVTKKLTDKFIEEKYKELKPYGYNFVEMNCEDYVKRIVGTYIGLDDRVLVIIIVSVSLITILSILAIFRWRK